jgi:hypothetical protein
MSVKITNNKNNIRLDYFGTTHIFQKEDLTIQSHVDTIVFKDAIQKQRVKYLDITFPYSQNIEHLIDILSGYIDSSNELSDTVSEGDSDTNLILSCILGELENITNELKQLNR